MSETKEKTLSDYFTIGIFFLIGLFSTHTAFRYLFGLTQSINSLLDEKYQPGHNSSPLAKLGGAIWGDVIGWLIFLVIIASIIFVSFWVIVFALRLGFGKFSAGVVLLIFYAVMATPSLREWHEDNYKTPKSVREKQRTEEQKIANAEIEKYILSNHSKKGQFIISATSAKESAEITIDLDGASETKKINDGLYKKSVNEKIVGIKKSGDQNLLLTLEFIVDELGFEKEEKYLLYTNGYRLIDKKDDSIVHCFFGGNEPCLENGDEWILEIESGCDCMNYSVNRRSIDASYIDLGTICKTSATQECKSRQFKKIKYVENGISFEVHQR